MARCPCTPLSRRRRRVDLTVPLDVRGRYRTMVLDGPGVLPETGTLEGDAAAARQAGASVELGSVVEVD